MSVVTNSHGEEFDLGCESGVLDAMAGISCRFTPINTDEKGVITISSHNRFHSDFAAGYNYAYLDWKQGHIEEYEEAQKKFKLRKLGKRKDD